MGLNPSWIFKKVMVKLKSSRFICIHIICQYLQRQSMIYGCLSLWFIQCQSLPFPHTWAVYRINLRLSSDLHRHFLIKIHSWFQIRQIRYAISVHQAIIKQHSFQNNIYTKCITEVSYCFVKQKGLLYCTWGKQGLPNKSLREDWCMV